MPSKLQGKWNIQNIIQITSEAYKSRFDYMARDVISSSVHIKRITVYDGKDPGVGSRTRFDITSQSWPQYYPYYTKKDSRGRERTYQRTTKHQYTVTIQMDYLTLTAPIKFRTGSDKKWEFNPNPALIKSKTNKYGIYLGIGDYNAQVLGVNGDFFFQQSYVRKMENCLFGRNHANSFPSKTNSKGLVFATKHELKCFLTLMENGILKKG